MKLKRKPDKRDYISIAGILLFTALIFFIARQYIIIFGGAVSGGFAATTERFRDIVMSYGTWGLAVLTLLHAVHVMISAIPAPVIMFAGAMLYGLPLGMLTGIVGIMLGSVIAFYTARLLGRNVVTLFISKKNLEKAEGLLSENVSAALLFALFILPSPKDFLPYFVGLTKFPARKFFFISLIGRLPGMLITGYAGDRVYESDFLPLILGAGLLVVIFTLSYIFRGRITEFIKASNRHK